MAAGDVEDGDDVREAAHVDGGARGAPIGGGGELPGGALEGADLRRERVGREALDGRALARSAGRAGAQDRRLRFADPSGGGMRHGMCGQTAVCPLLLRRRSVSKSTFGQQTGETATTHMTEPASLTMNASLTPTCTPEAARSFSRRGPASTGVTGAAPPKQRIDSGSTVTTCRGWQLQSGNSRAAMPGAGIKVPCGCPRCPSGESVGSAGCHAARSLQSVTVCPPPHAGARDT